MLAVSQPLPFTNVPRPQRGVSLIEVLIGIVIGLVGILVMFQTVTTWNARSRTTASGSGAQAAGTLAMYQLERDIKLAGLGFGTAPTEIMGCTVVANDGGARNFDFPLLPVRIIDGGADGEPDQISVLYGNSSFLTAGESFNQSDAVSTTMRRRAGLRPGDLVIVAGNDDGTPASADCVLKQITDNTSADGVTVAHAVGSYDDFYTATAQVARFNGTAASAPTFSSGSVFSLGPRARFNVWQIDGGRVLSHTDLIHDAAPFEVAEGVINLQAQYGVDSDGDGRIGDAEWAVTAPTDWRRVLAIRVGMLVRSRQFEKPPANAGESAWTATQPSWVGGPFKMTDVGGGTADSAPTDSPDNWRNYRYRVYESVIALRNVIWGTSP